MPEDRKIRRALISVYDKTGVVEFARALHDEFGIEIISTGGTAKTLRDAGIAVTLVEEITGFPEMLDGRVKTLHPKIHAAILADRDNPEHMRQLAEQGIDPIDMVVVNLYPFEQTISKPDCTFEEAIEMIDIGGPCLLRAAAKNHVHVVPVVSPEQYAGVLKHPHLCAGRGALSWRRQFAAAAIRLTSRYDYAVCNYLAAERPFKSSLPPQLDLRFAQVPGMRYGENPHQTAARYVPWEHAKEPGPFFQRYPDDYERSISFNNYFDANSALQLCAELTRSRSPLATCCFVKHTNACGAAVDSDTIEAYRRAYLGDPNAAMGGILAVDFDVDAAFAETVMETYTRWGKAAGAGGFFVEVWLAPSFDKDAVEVIRTKKDWGKRARLLSVGDMSVAPDPSEMDFKRIAGGMLTQSRDLVGLDEEQWKVVTARSPTEQEMNDLRLAWLIAKHTKSNAICICRDGMLIGNGAGQMSRVMSCRIATWLAEANGHGEVLQGAAAASDGFFPFRDGPDLLMDAGISSLIQPGGSKRDAEVIAACDERGAAMILTGTRHFKH